MLLLLGNSSVFNDYFFIVCDLPIHLHMKHCLMNHSNSNSELDSWHFSRNLILLPYHKHISYNFCVTVHHCFINDSSHTEQFINICCDHVHSLNNKSENVFCFFSAPRQAKFAAASATDGEYLNHLITIKTYLYSTIIKCFCGLRLLFFHDTYCKLH